MNAKPAHACVATLIALVVASCGFDPADVPLPGSPAGRSSYTLHAEFINVLNLPARAPIRANGEDIGSVADVRLDGDGDGAIVDMDIDSGVTVSTGATAELRQDTLLGDIYIAVAPPEQRTPPLPAGATIPRHDTRSSTSIEDLLQGIAVAVNGGVIGSTASAVTAINAALPADPEDLRKLVRKDRQIVRDLAASTAAFDTILDSVSSASESIASNQKTVTGLLDAWPSWQPALAGITDQLARYFEVIPAFTGPLADFLLTNRRADNLNALLDAISPLIQAIGTADLTAPDVLRPLDTLLSKKVTPLLQGSGGIDVHLPAVDLDPALLNALRATGLIS